MVLFSARSVLPAAPSRNGKRLKVLLFLVLTFGLVYILLLNSAVPLRSAINTYDVQASSSPIAVLTNKSNDTLRAAVERLHTSQHHDSLATKTLPSSSSASIVNFDIRTLNFPNVSSNESQQQESSDQLPACPPLDKITTYKKHLSQASLLIEDLQEVEVEALYGDALRPGGEWRPSHCRARHKVAIIIPYRDRKSHLSRLLNFLIPIMQTQLLDFRFIVTEQYGDDLFNKGRIMNAAFRLAQKLGVGCVIFHDVDMFPQDDRIPYDCPDTPRHLGAYVSSLGYQLWYPEIVGGALSLQMSDFLNVNGWSNLYWGWGGEDDDMGTRLLSQNYTIERPNQQYARYSMLKHTKRKRTAPKLIYKLLDTAATRWVHDGVNETGLWTITALHKRPLYYHLIVNVGESPLYWRET